jgi:hypothetical protein
MDQNQFLSAVVELGLDLLEKRGTFLPFCQAVNAAAETFMYTPASISGEGFTEAQASQSVRANVRRDLGPRGLVGLAFCRHTRVRFADSADKVPAVEVELHYRGQPPAVWHFPYKMEGKTATVLEYYTTEAVEDLFSGAEPGAAPDSGGTKGDRSPRSPRRRGR